MNFNVATNYRATRTKPFEKILTVEVQFCEATARVVLLMSENLNGSAKENDGIEFLFQKLFTLR